MLDGTPIHRIVLDGRIRVAILTYGVAIQSIEAPDRDGHLTDIVLGLNTLADYIAYSPHFGAVPSRYAGRIQDARDDHESTIHARRALHIGPDAMPIGAFCPIADTPLDFTTPRTISSRLRSGHPQMLRARGYDHAFLLDDTDLRHVARLVSQASGRALNLLTTQPALQLYTGNALTGAYAGHSGRSYRPGDAVCLEAQHLPDSPNHSHFPSTILRPNDTSRAIIQFRFGMLSGLA